MKTDREDGDMQESRHNDTMMKDESFNYLDSKISSVGTIENKLPWRQEIVPYCL
jgi:hypothetical protein